MSGAEPVRAFVGLGANLGDRAQALQAAVGALAEAEGVEVAVVSPVYESEAHTSGGEPQPPYLNAVAELRTTLAPPDLLALLHRVERAAGRERRERWAPRTLDLDLLLFGDYGEVVLGGGDSGLTVPHPRLAERRFVLRPLADLAPNLVVPGGTSAPDRTVRALLAACPDPHAVTRTSVSPLTSSQHPVGTQHAASLPSGRNESVALPETLRYVAVEGVIGVGKTSLARRLAAWMGEQAPPAEGGAEGVRLVLEEFEENPFLPDFYRDPARWAFHTQLAFLASRFRQQKGLLARDLFQQRTVSDYTFDKDRIFAHTTLAGDELALYESLYGLMEPATATPDLVVYLRASVDRLMHNVAQRGRAYEARIERSYLAELADAYDRYFRHYTRGPLLIVDATAIDFVGNEADFERLAAKVAATAGRPGTVEFNPPGSLELDFS